MIKHKNIYFLGIGGIGMSALAKYCFENGITVSGYDKTRTELTISLEKMGISIHYEENINLIPPDIDLVVYTPAIPADNVELIYLKDKQIPILKRAEFLAQIVNQHKTIAVAGTHGKTSVSSIITHILKTANKNIMAFVGGIMKNYNNNVIYSPAPDYCVVEADEFDKSFLHLKPTYAIITSMDADHLDIYSNYENMVNSYLLFIANIKTNGLLISNKNLNLKVNEISNYTYSINSISDYTINNLIKLENGYKFNFVKKNEIVLKDVVFNQIGKHNLENLVAAIALCYEIGIEPEAIKEAAETYQGVKRRLDFQLKTDNVIYIDDYAHHPSEIKALIEAVREFYPNKKITGIFQPHLYSRTRDFLDGFITELNKLDECILLDIYPAREKPIEGVSSKLIAEKLTKPVYYTSKNNVFEVLNNIQTDIVLTIGAGDIDTLVNPLKHYLINKTK